MSLFSDEMDKLHVAADELIADDIIYTRSGETPVTLKGDAEFGERIAEFFATSAVVPDAMVEMNAADFTVAIARTDLFTLPDANDYNPVKWYLDEDGKRFTIGLKVA